MISLEVGGDPRKVCIKHGTNRDLDNLGPCNCRGARRRPAAQGMHHKWEQIMI